MTKPDANGWCPIATAPRDEDVAVLLCDVDQNMKVGWITWWDENDLPVWWDGEHRVDATHWQPLPAPPEDAA